MRTRRTELETYTVGIMIGMYCRGRRHASSGLCGDCTALLNYARQRTANCPHGEAKPACSECRIHCYTAGMREKMRSVMKFCGPRMLLLHPILTIRHFFRQP